MTPYPITPVEEFGSSTNTSVNAEYPALVKYGGSQLQIFGVSNGQAHAVFRYQSESDKGNATRIIEVADFTDSQKSRAKEVADGSLPNVSSGTTIKYYNIWNMRSDKIVSYSEGGTQLTQTDANETYSAFYFRAVDDGYYIYSATNGLPLKDVSSNSVTFGTNKDDATKYYFIPTTQSFSTYWATLSASGYCISTSSTLSESTAWNDSGQTGITKYRGNDGGSVWRFSTAINGTNNIATLRGEAKECIDNYSIIGASESAKNALEEVYNETFSSVAELSAALLEFRNSISPVFRIKSGHDGYAANSYIYRDARVNELKWSTSSDIADFSLVKLETTEGLPYTSTSVVAGTYNIIQLYSNDVLFGSSATIADVADSDGQFTITVGGNKKHAQNSGNYIVNWNSDGYNANGPSTWTFEYVGNASELGKEIARAETRSIYNHIKDYTFGSGYGNYTCGSYDSSDVNSDRITLGLSLSNPSGTFEQLNNQLEALGMSKFSDLKEMYEYLNDYSGIYGDAVISINVPAAGSFVRVKASPTYISTQTYLTSQNVFVGNYNNCAFTQESSKISGKETILYYDGTSLLGYSTGLWLKNNGGYAEWYTVPAATGTSVAFTEASNGAIGKYNVKFNNARYLYTHSDDNGIYSDAGGSASSEGYNFVLEPVTSLPVTISSVGYATFYAPVALEIPAEITAYVAADKGTYLSLTAIEGGIIPANTGVILAGAEGNYDFNITTGGSVESNALTGTVATISRPENSYIFTTGQSGIGFYKDGVNKIPGFKAYLAAESGGAVKAFRFEENETGLTPTLHEGEGVIYDLSGRRVCSNLKKGLYIVNGKKVLF